VGNTALQTKRDGALTDVLDYELLHYDKIAVRDVLLHWAVRPSYLLEFDNPPADTVIPLEYAFHLLGDVHGKTVVDLGCGDGLNSVVLATLGARVIAVDSSEKNLKITNKRVCANGVAGRVSLVRSDAGVIPVASGIVDRVLCAGALNRDDCVFAARQIRRILKPGGAAVFFERVGGFEWVRRFTAAQSLTRDDALRVGRAVGRGSRPREFMLTSRLLERIGFASAEAMRRAHALDAWLLSRFAIARRAARALVWEARKES
jgi:SAM-dependent methyltransferase